MKKILIDCCLNIIFLSLIFLSSCSKDSNSNSSGYTTVKPLPYLPVYPGSYWKYLEGNDTVISRTSDDWILFEGAVYLSTLDGYPVYQYSKFSFFANTDPWFTIVSEKVNSSFSEYLGDPISDPWIRETKVIRKTIDSHYDSIIVQRYHNHHLLPQQPTTPEIGYQIYKKYVGLVFECRIDTTTNDTVYKKVIINYFINHHFN